MGKKIEMMGKRFGRLVVIEEAERHISGHARWICKCDCGNTTTPIIGDDLRSGKTRSCGCLHKEQLSDVRKKHGLKRTRLYSIWQNMKNRCRNENVPCYNAYGGRGIAVCAEWENDFQAFYNWAMLHGYSDDLTIDRIDVNGSYCPDNCRWISVMEQTNNLRKNIVLEIDGETHTIAEWSRISGIKYFTLYQRYLRGWKGHRLIEPPQENRGCEEIG